MVLHGLLRYRDDGDPGALLLAGFGAVVAVALGLYFRTIDKRYQGKDESNPGDPDPN